MSPQPKSAQRPKTPPPAKSSAVTADDDIDGRPALRLDFGEGQVVLIRQFDDAISVSWPTPFTGPEVLAQCNLELSPGEVQIKVTADGKRQTVPLRRLDTFVKRNPTATTIRFNMATEKSFVWSRGANGLNQFDVISVAIPTYLDRMLARTAAPRVTPSAVTTGLATFLERGRSRKPKG
jgi:hypothetical protein